MIWVGAAIGGAYLLTRSDWSTSQVVVATLLNAVILPYYDRTMWPANGAEWSLFYEMLANIYFALTCPSMGPRRLTFLIGSTMVVLICVTIEAGHLRAASTPLFILLGCARVGFSFFLGVALARSRAWWRPRLIRVPSWVILLLTAVLFAVPARGDYRTAYDIVAVICFSPLLIMLGSVARPIKRYKRLAAAAAVVSYPLYAIHLAVKPWVETIIDAGGLNEAATAIVACLLLPPVSWPLAVAYDAPVGRWLTRRQAARTPAVPNDRAALSRC